MAVASFQPAAVVYREEQNFGWWAYALVIAVEVLIWAILGQLRRIPHPAGLLSRWALALALGIAVYVALPVMLVVGFLRMTTEVTPTDLRVWFGWLPTYRRIVPVGTIVRLEVVSYRPLADYWGWGIRSGRDGERVLNARGNRGVRIELSDGTRLLIGSQRPEVLAVALERAPCCAQEYDDVLTRPSGPRFRLGDPRRFDADGPGAFVDGIGVAVAVELAEQDRGAS